VTTRKFPSLALLSLVAVSALVLLAACGGDDDDDGGGGGNSTTTSGGGNITTSGGTGSDEDFVADICKAGKQFAADFQTALKDLGTNASDPNKIAEKLTKPVEDFVKAFAKAKPPKDLKDWHEQATSQMNLLVKNLKENNDFSAFEEQDQPFPDPPANAEERLSKVAEKNKDCQDAGIFND
jgi:hypothetical protein